MTGQVPSYLVRNLVEVTLGKTDPKRTRKTRSNKTLCLAIPTKSFRNQDDGLEEIKALLKLHKRYDIEAERTLYNGVAKTEEKDSKNFDSHNLSAVGTAIKTKPKNNYLKEIYSKLSLPPSPELPALSGAEQTSKELNCFSEKRLSSTKSRQKIASSLMLPALTDKPFISRESLTNNEDRLQKNFKRNESENCENLNLQDNLTVVPLDRKNFAYYDSLAKFYGIGPNSDSRSAVGTLRDSKPSVGILVSVPDCTSEDGLYVNFEDYLREVSDVESIASQKEGGSEHNQLEGASEFIEPSLALVEYKPLYRKNVHFCEDLHEVHLYSPVQNHWRRRRRSRRYTEDDV